jgi:hypothetical protein
MASKLKKSRNKLVSLKGKKKRVQLGWSPLQEILIDENAIPSYDPRTLHSVWINNKYQIAVYPHSRPNSEPMVWLSIKRRDRKAIRDGRDFQRIKNELLGTICEGVELYPMENRYVDTANQYHLFCLPPGKRFSFGFEERIVSHEERPDEQIKALMQGPAMKEIKQRKFQPHHKSEDLTEIGLIDFWSVIEITIPPVGEFSESAEEAKANLMSVDLNDHEAVPPILKEFLDEIESGNEPTWSSRIERTILLSQIYNPEFLHSIMRIDEDKSP